MGHDAVVTVEVVPYDPAWPDRFARIRQELHRLLDGVPVLAIEHVGSTSVPGLAAKPVIDVDVVVGRQDVDAAVAALERGGYRYRGDLGIADRHSLAEPDDGVRRNVYVVVDGSLALRNHLAVRAALRDDPELRAHYAALKEALAARVTTIEEYVPGKTALLVGILRDAGFTDGELAEIDAANRPRAATDDR